MLLHLLLLLQGGMDRQCGEGKSTEINQQKALRKITKGFDRPILFDQYFRKLNTC
jgi:hypothetical protein